MDNVYEKWFAEYTTKMREHISNASATGAAPFTKLGWNLADLPAVLDEVDLKIEHSYLVRDRCKEIARWLKLSDRDVELAAITGLFHDLGRFRQAVKFGTMNDVITGSHGEMSADIFLCDAPKDGLGDKEISIIDSALRYHNVFKLPEKLSGRALRFTQLARDADKLDIFRFYTDKTEKRSFRFIAPEGEGAYSSNMLENVLQGKNLQVSGIQNKNDRKLMQVSLVYDINFGYSFQFVLEKRYLDKITGIYDGTADFVMQKVHAYAVKWMEKRIQQTGD